ncbi:MAG: AgmX/PglI C-terminal domain-containing protein, partial [Deltaproteobacteria bacterium]|nr:AgmX/PglI C-terminal domain-containing protein [Deltaproteobacteria bacterium]
KKEGQTASLLEQQRPNVFQMSVANILPGDEIKVELRYTELIQSEDKIYQFVYPAVVGPRYSDRPKQEATDREKWVETPYLREGQAPPYAFGLSLDINAGLPIDKLSSPSHQIEVDRSQPGRAKIKVKDSPQAGTKDFVLNYQLAGGQIQTGLLLYPGQEENFFLLMVEPPARVEAEAILPREYIFIVDVSGSMRGFPLNVSKALMKKIISDLKPDEYFNLLLFAGGSAVLSPEQSLRADQTNKKRALDWLNSLKGCGGTRLLPALERALNLPRTQGVSRIVVVVTDGYVSAEPQAFELIRRSLGQANLFAFGIGSSVNRHLIEGMARAGQGQPLVVLKEDQAQDQAAKFRRYIESPVLTGIKVSFDGFEAHQVEPEAVGDLFALKPIVLCGKYKGKPGGRIVVQGRTARGEFSQKIEVKDALVSADNSALKFLWARTRVAALSDLNDLKPSDERVKEVTRLGLKYGLLTAQTSFVAVDKIKRADGQWETVKQPLPLPQGVTDAAVGGKRMLKLASPAPARGRTLSAESQAEAAPAGPQVRFEIIKIEGQVDRAGLDKALKAKSAQFKACYGQALSRKPDLKGELTLALVINAQGRVVQDKVVLSSFKDQNLVNCLVQVLKKMSFPRPQSGPLKMTLRLRLSV